MILILSNNTDASTNNIIDWLEHLKVRWFRINEDDKIEITRIQLSEKEPIIDLLVNGYKLCLKDVSGYWYRRGWLYTRSPVITVEDVTIRNHLQHHISNETKYMVRFVYQYLARYKRSISNFLTAENDKLWYLQLASESGLSIPESIVCKTAIELAEFKENHSNIITKSIHELISIQFENFSIGSRTYLLDNNDGEHDKTEYLPSLFQKYIDKLFELRIFFLHNDLYAMAIFSQENEQTKVDFRNYDYERPNRRVPYKLPDIVIGKLKLFVAKAGFNSGSIDMIVTRAMEYVFLEINPIGQFGMVSYPCNYFLEKKIAQHFLYEQKAS